MKEHITDTSRTFVENTNRTSNEQTYTAKELSEQFEVSDATIRVRWMEWLVKVAPQPLLKTTAGYTELARTLMAEFAQVDKADRGDWVTAAKTRYAAEWSSAGVIDAELMPDEVGGALALLKTQGNASEIALQTELGDVETFLSQVADVEADFSDAELASYRAAGARRGVARFKIETQAELEVLNALRSKRMEGQQ